MRGTAALLLLFCPAAALAETPSRLAVLPAVVEGPHGRAASKDLFGPVRDTADFRTGLDLLSYNAVFVDGVEPVATTVRDCGSDVACIARTLRFARIDLGLRVIANFALNPPLLTFNLIDAKEEKVVAEALAELDGRPLIEVLKQQTADLLDRGGYRIGGRIALSVTPIDAAVAIRPPVSQQIVIDPGTYSVTASKEGYLPKTIDVLVRPGEESAAQLVLDEVPPEPSVLASPWLWTAVGVVVVGATAAVLVATDPFSSDPTNPTICVTTAAGSCPMP